MSIREVHEAIASAGIPCSHMAWPRGSAPNPPWAVYGEESQPAFHADNAVYVGAASWEVDLVQTSSDPNVEAALEAAIQERFGPFDKSEEYDGAEGCLVTTYSFTEIQKKEGQ